MMPVKNYFLAVTAAICFLSFQSCKKSESPAPDPVPVIKPDTLTTGWTKRVISGETNLGDIFFNSATTGYVVGSKIYKSTDGGNNWLQVSSTGDIYNIYMTNDNKAFFASYVNAIYKTVDGGSNFTTTVLPVTPYDIFFTDNITGYIITQNGLYNTVDAGVTWVKLATTGLPATSNYSTLSFVNNTTGWVLIGGNIYKNTGSILNWQQATVTGGTPSHAFASVYPTSLSNIYVSNFNGQIFKSTDGGSNFSFIKQLDEGYSDLHFITDMIGYASGGRHVYKTTDGGVNWTKVVSLGESTIVELHFTDANHGWACGSNGTVLIFKQ